MNCINCNHNLPVQAQFCGNCGQSIKINRLNREDLTFVFTDGVLSMNKGLLFTIYWLYRNPIKVVQEYLSGKRAKYFHHFAIFLATLTILGFVSTISGGKNILMNQQNAAFQNEKPEKKGLNDFSTKSAVTIEQRVVSTLSSTLNNYMKEILSLVVLVITIFINLLFKKSKLNLYEHFAIVCFVLSASHVVVIIPDLLLLTTNNTALFLKSTDYINIISFMVVCIWMVRIYNNYNYSVISSFLRFSLSAFLGFTLFIIVFTGFIFLKVIYL